MYIITFAARPGNSKSTYCFEHISTLVEALRAPTLRERRVIAIQR